VIYLVSYSAGQCYKYFVTSNTRYSAISPSRLS